MIQKLHQVSTVMRNSMRRLCCTASGIFRPTAFLVGLWESQEINIQRQNTILFFEQKVLHRAPFEVNVSWFKSRKAPIKIFGLLPVGKKTGVAIGSGLKIYGNVSKKSFAALAGRLSFGYPQKILGKKKLLGIRSFFLYCLFYSFNNSGSNFVWICC